MIEQQREKRDGKGDVRESQSGDTSPNGGILQSKAENGMQKCWLRSKLVTLAVGTSWM